MGKIVTEQEAYNIDGSGSYTDTQLVQLEDLSSKYIQLTVSNSTDEDKGYVRASLVINNITIINRQNYYHETYYIE